MNRQRGKHLCRDLSGMKVAPTHWRDVLRIKPDRCGHMMMVAKNTVGRVEADPARAGQVSLGPRMQGSFGAPLCDRRFVQITTRKARRNAELTHRRSKQYREVPARATPHRKRLRSRSGGSLIAPFVNEVFAQRAIETDEHLDRR